MPTASGVSRTAHPLPRVAAFATATPGWGLAIGDERAELIGDEDGSQAAAPPVPPADAASTADVGSEFEFGLLLDATQAASPVGACTAWRGAEGGADIDSLRLLVLWFAKDHALGLLALRPRGAGGQDRDRLSVVSVGEQPGMHVFDPRLSVTLGPGGAPRRIGVELWVGETEEGEQYPHRLAAEATGASLSRRAGTVSIEAYELRAHSRQATGTGTFVIVRPA